MSLGFVKITWLLVSRITLLLIGILLLVIALPHKDPWNMSLVEVKGDKGQEVIIHLPKVKEFDLLSIVKFPIYTSAKKIFISASVCLLALMSITSPGRRALLNSTRKIRPIPAFLLSMGLFVFTLKPTQSGMPIVLYLIFGVMGTLLSFIGLYPLFIRLGKYRIGGIIRRIAKHLSYFFYNTKLIYFLGAIFIIAFTLTNLISYYIFEHIPHIQDSIDQVFHGKIFAIGQLTVPSHELRQFFDFTHMINDGKWYSEYPPAHSFLMMFGVLLGMPWIINPLMGSLSIITFYFIGRELYDEKTGRIASALGLFSPFIIFMSSEFMSHGSALFFISTFILFFAKTVHYRKIYHPILSGASLGMALNGRPMTALAIVVPFAIYALILLIRGFRKYLLYLAILMVTLLLFVGILLLFNYLTTGHPLLFGYEVRWGKGHNPGFGHAGWGEPHTPSRGLRQNLNNLNALNKYLFEWQIPSLFFVLLLFASLTKNKWDYMLIGSFWALSIAYFFYWFQDWCFGPRFMYESSVMAIVLTSRSLMRTPILVSDVFGLKTSPGRIKATVGTVVILCIILGLSFNIRPLVRVYSNNYWGVNASVFKAVKEKGIKNAVVFVRSYYGSVFIGNSPLLDGEVIYARDMAGNNRLLMDYYPDRGYYLANGSDIKEIRNVAPKHGTLIEAESLSFEVSAGDNAEVQDMTIFNGGYWSGNAQILATTNAPGDYVIFKVPIDKEGEYKISVYMTTANDYGIVQLFVNGKPLGEPYDGYDPEVLLSDQLNMGKIYLHKGENLFKIQVTGKNDSAVDYFFGVDCFVLEQINVSKSK